MVALEVLVDHHVAQVTGSSLQRDAARRSEVASRDSDSLTSSGGVHDEGNRRTSDSVGDRSPLHVALNDDLDAITSDDGLGSDTDDESVTGGVAACLNDEQRAVRAGLGGVHLNPIALGDGTVGEERLGLTTVAGITSLTGLKELNES